MKNNISTNKEEQTYKAGEVMSMLEQINDGVQVIGEQYKEITNRLDVLQDDVTEIKFKLSEKVDRSEFNKMEKRVVKLEKLVFAKLS